MRMRKGMVAGVLAAVLAMLFLAGTAEEVLSGYSSAQGYTYLQLGSFPQWIEGGYPPEKAWYWSRNKLTDNPPQVDPSPILWRVLSTGENEALLLSEYVLFAMPMHTNITEYKSLGSHFADTQMSHYLNEVFLPDAFAPEEQALLLADESGQLVTLLTSKQLNDKSLGLGTNATRKAWATEYAIRVTDVFVYRISMGQHTPYWVQDQSTTDSRHARCTKQTGEIGHIVCDRENEGARPVIRIQLQGLSIASGDGTLEHPYTLSTPEAGASDTAR